MKKLIASICVFIISISMVFATTTSGRFVAYDDGEYIGTITLLRSGQFTFEIANGNRYSGNYTIKTDNDENPEPGYTYTIVFKMKDGSVEKGSYVEPL